MKSRLVTFVVTAIGSVCAFAYAFNSPTSRTVQPLTPFEFKRDAAPTAESAARSLFLGVATASPREFVQHLLLGGCDNEIDVLQDFAEAMHATQFSHDGEGFTYYEMCEKHYRRGTEATRLIHRKNPVRVIVSAAFDTSDPEVRALGLEAA